MVVAASRSGMRCAHSDVEYRQSLPGLFCNSLEAGAIVPLYPRKIAAVEKVLNEAQPDTVGFDKLQSPLKDNRALHQVDIDVLGLAELISSRMEITRRAKPSGSG
jgi:hypothetical protein